MTAKAQKPFNAREFLAKNATIAILVGMCILITIANPKFLSVSNLFSVLSAACVYGCMALGATFIIISGGIDLAAGSVVAFAGVVGACFGQTMEAADKVLSGVGELPFIVPVIMTLLAGVLCGGVTGFLISKFKTPPFIVTLGMTTVVRGATLLITGGEPVSNLSHGYAVLGGQILGAVPVAVIVFAILIALCIFIQRRTRFGVDMYALGTNERAAAVSGVRVFTRKISIYIFGGLMYAVAGMIVAARASSIHPGAAQGYELTAISASIIGGTSPVGGSGTTWGVVVGTLILSVIRQGLTLLAVDAYWQQIAEGAIIVIAVIFALMRRNKEA